MVFHYTDFPTGLILNNGVTLLDSVWAAIWISDHLLERGVHLCATNTHRDRGVHMCATNTHRDRGVHLFDTKIHRDRGVYMCATNTHRPSLYMFSKIRNCRGRSFCAFTQNSPEETSIPATCTDYLIHKLYTLQRIAISILGN
jgi:hypothetical protein